MLCTAPTNSRIPNDAFSRRTRQLWFNANVAASLCSALSAATNSLHFIHLSWLEFDLYNLSPPRFQFFQLDFLQWNKHSYSNQDIISHCICLTEMVLDFIKWECAFSSNWSHWTFSTTYIFKLMKFRILQSSSREITNRVHSFTWNMLFKYGQYDEHHLGSQSALSSHQ